MKTLLFIITLITSFNIQAQIIEFEYDDAGNRVRRSLCTMCTSPRPAGPDSTASDSYSLEANILPNPTKGNLAIEVTEATFTNNQKNDATGKEQSHFHVVVYDLYGREILNEQHTSANFKIDITKQPPGAYFVKLYMGNKFKQWEIVKN